MLKVKHCENEPTRFWVEGNSWRCSNRPNCKARFLKREHSMMREGMTCPKCHKGKIEENWHLCDLASYDGAGKCSCEWHSFSVAPKLEKMSKEQRILRPMFCGHLQVARTFCLDVLLRLHIWEQRGRRPINPENEI